MGRPEEERTESLFKQVIDQNFPNLCMEGARHSNKEPNKTCNYLHEKNFLQDTLH